MYYKELKDLCIKSKNLYNTIKDVKDVEKLRTTYDSIVNEIIQEREDAVRIAQAYKAELDRIIS